MRFEQIEAKAREMGINVQYAVWRRQRYLRDRMNQLLDEMDFYDICNDEVADAWSAKCDDEFMRLAHEARNLALAAKSKGIKPKTDLITDEMIEAARAYPIAQIIDFKRGKCQCINPEHEDKHPSMYHGTRTNTAQCPSCGFKADSIKAYMLIHGNSFHESVRALQ